MNEKYLRNLMVVQQKIKTPQEVNEKDVVTTIDRLEKLIATYMTRDLSWEYSGDYRILLRVLSILKSWRREYPDE